MTEEALRESAVKHVRAILEKAIRLKPSEGALIVYDEQTRLSRILTDAYRAALPDALYVDFDSIEEEAIKRMISERTSGDIVVLIQSSNFRLNEFRIRIELFQRGLKTIEHMHLNRMTGEQEQRYIDTLAYDPDYYHPLGHALKERLDHTQKTTVECADTVLTYASRMKPAKLNIGDYREMQNVGGTFPIGEVFTEAENLEAVNGDVKIFAFAGIDLIAREYEPFAAHIQNGILTAGEDAPEEFQRVLDLIREDEPVIVREFGLGLNPAIGKGSLLNDVTAFERMKGLHLSLGGKHGIYKRKGAKRGRYHVDVFIDTKRILLDDDVIFENGEFTRAL